MSKHFILVVYDVSHNRRRTKLHNALKNFGTPVQYSVFECLLSPTDVVKMKAQINKVIKPRLDRVRYYPICQSCLKGVEISSGPEVLADTDSIVV